MINGNKNEAENHDTDRPRHGPTYDKYKICLTIMMFMY